MAKDPDKKKQSQPGDTIGQGETQEPEALAQLLAYAAANPVASDSTLTLADSITAREHERRMTDRAAQQQRELNEHNRKTLKDKRDHALSMTSLIAAYALAATVVVVVLVVTDGDTRQKAALIALGGVFGGGGGFAVGKVARKVKKGK